MANDSLTPEELHRRIVRVIDEIRWGFVDRTTSPPPEQQTTAAKEEEHNG